MQVNKKILKKGYVCRCNEQNKKVPDGEQFAKSKMLFLPRHLTYSFKFVFIDTVSF
jgi:hypothetical protein